MIDLERKLGPLPTWVWIAGGVGFVFLLHRRTAGVGVAGSVEVAPSDLAAPQAFGGPIDQGRDRTDRTDQGDIGDTGGGGGDTGDSLYRGSPLFAPNLVGFSSDTGSTDTLVQSTGSGILSSPSFAIFGGRSPSVVRSPAGAAKGA